MYYDIGIVHFSKMLKNLSGILDKAQAFADQKKIDIEVLLNSRLIADQFNFIRQVQIACDTAKLGAARLCGKEAPNHPDTEKTLPELKARVESVLGYLQTFKKEDFAQSDDRKITTPRWEQKWLTGKEGFSHHVVPNFYFHITTAYSILRSNGVEIGKKDYLGTLPFKTE